MNEGRLIAAIELKSHPGPSFGNNCNNRAEEAIGSAHDLWTAYRSRSALRTIRTIGSAHDLWTAYREGAFGKQARPFLGWLILVEDCAKSRSNVQSKEPHFPVFPEFKNASYADRYDLLCQRLMQENVYTAAATILSPRTAKSSGTYCELSELTGLKNFVITLASYVAAEAERQAKVIERLSCPALHGLIRPASRYFVRVDWDVNRLLAQLSLFMSSLIMSRRTPCRPKRHFSVIPTYILTKCLL